MRTMSLLAFLPQEIIPLLMVFGGIALILQLKKVAIALFTTCGLMIILPVIIEPFLEMLPGWALSLMIFVFWISMIGMLITMIIGRNARDQMVGTLAADMFKWVLFFPFRILGRIFRRSRR